MSRHYVVMYQDVFHVSRGANSALLNELEATHPEIARNLRKINWVVLSRELMKRAIKDVAASIGATVERAYDNSYGSYSNAQAATLPEGCTMLGVLRCGNVQLGFAEMKDGTFRTFQNGGSRESGTKEWQNAVKRRYAELGIEAAMALQKCEVRTAERDGESIIVALLPKKEGER